MILFLILLIFCYLSCFFSTLRNVIWENGLSILYTNKIKPLAELICRVGLLQKQYIYLYRGNKIKSYYAAVRRSAANRLTPILPFHHLHKRFLSTVIILYFISSAKNPICRRLLGGNCFRNDNGMLKLSGFPESPGL